MMNEGKIDEVFEKVRMQMQKQFGKIVSVEEAANSPQAAAQLVKQRAILKQGPLGQFAKDDQTASKILEAFRAKEEGKTTVPLSESILKEQMDRGTQIEEQSYTELTKIRALLESQRGQANIMNLGTAEQTFAARTGIKNNSIVGDTRSESKDRLRQYMKQGEIKSGESVRHSADSLVTGQVIDRSATVAKENVTDTLGFVKSVPDIVSGVMDTLKSRLIGPTLTPITTEASQRAELEKGMGTKTKNTTINNTKIVKPTMPVKENTILVPASEMNKPPIPAKSPTVNVTPTGTGIQPLLHLHGQDREKAKLVSASKQVQQAVAANGVPTENKKEAVNLPQNTIVSKPAELPERKVQVEITGYCINCKNEIAGSKQLSSTSIGTKEH
jgi:ribosomal protein S13